MSSIYQNKYTLDLGNNYIPYNICFTPTSMRKTIEILKKILKKKIKVNNFKKKENLYKFIYFRRYMNSKNKYSTYIDGKNYLFFKQKKILIHGNIIYEFFYFILRGFGYIFPFFKGTLNK